MKKKKLNKFLISVIAFLVITLVLLKIFSTKKNTLAIGISPNGKVKVEIVRIDPIFPMQSPYLHKAFVYSEKPELIKEEFLCSYDSEIGEESYSISWKDNKILIHGNTRKDVDYIINFPY